LPGSIYGIACVVEEFSQEYLKSSKLYKLKLSEEIPPRGIGI
jgi:hypothetical protein